MQRNDSNSAMASLAVYADESDVEESADGDHANIVGGDISGSDDDDIPNKMRRTDAIVHDSTPSSEIFKTSNKVVSRLVSYGAEDDEEDKVGGGESSDDDVKKYDISINADMSSSLSRSVRNLKAQDIKIPPEPPGKCSRHLQEKMVRFYEKMKQGGLNLNHTIQKRTDFRNPSIYEKLIDYCHINEKGTNYPPELYNTGLWGKESFYDELAKAQKVEMDKREKERKDRTKVEFVLGTARKSASTAALLSLGVERKSKWDAPQSQPAVQPKMVAHGSGPQVVSVSASATGKKTTVISAVGTISKKKQ